MKVRVVQVGAEWGKNAAKLHVSYLERDGVERDGAPGTLYGPSGPIERSDFERELPGEKHQFRIIVSPEDGHELDLKAYVRQYMEQVRQDLGQELIWSAVNHYNTDNPHAHVIIRGVDAKGLEVRLGREYVSHGLRHRAEDLANEKLGPRPEHSRIDQLKREAELERYTSLDHALERRAVGGIFRPEAGAGRDPHLDAALRTRLEVLSRLGLASRSGRSDWRLASELRTELEQMGRRAEGMSAIRSVLAVSGARCRVIDRAEPNEGHRGELDRGVHGVIRWKGLDEAGQFCAVLETTGGLAYHLPVSSRVAAHVRVGQVVDLRRAADKDQRIEVAARKAGWSYDLSSVPERVRAADRGRLEQLERLGLAARDATSTDRWYLKPDFRSELAKGKPQPYWQMLSVRANPQSLDAQRKFQGPVWLDGVRLGELGSTGFGREVGDAVAARHEYLRGLGLEPDAEKLRWQLLKLQQQRLERSLIAGGGAPVRSPNGFEGTVHVHREGNGARFVEVRSRSGHFALVPAARHTEALEGQVVRLYAADKGRVRLEAIGRDHGPER